MRVIAGQARGHRLKGPPTSATRPMADKIREALFSSLTSLGIAPTRVLDLYSGTGSVGIEALSRGASTAVFVEQQRAACNVIEQNLEHTRFTDRATIVRQDVHRVISRASDSFDFIVLDPPYADPAIPATIEAVVNSRLVQSGTIIALGHWPRARV